MLNTQLLPGKSYLYSGDNQEMMTIVTTFDPVDINVFDATETDVEAARLLVAQAQLGAFGAKRLLLIENADRLTEVVQNTLLKLLEEPPTSVVIILQTEQPQKLLPTVMSRLHFLNSQNPKFKIGQSHFQIPLADMFGKLTDMTRESLVAVLTDEINYQREQLLTAPSYQLANRVQLLDRVIRKLNSNANQKLTIDWLLLHWGGD